MDRDNPAKADIPIPLAKKTADNSNECNTIENTAGGANWPKSLYVINTDVISGRSCGCTDRKKGIFPAPSIIDAAKVAEINKPIATQGKLDINEMLMAKVPAPIYPIVNNRLMPQRVPIFPHTGTKNTNEIPIETIKPENVSPIPLSTTKIGA